MWNLLKLRMVLEYTPLTSNLLDLNKLGQHGKFLDNHYKTHFDITSGGQIVKYPWIAPAFDIFFKAVSISNRLNPTKVGSNILSNQLKIQHLIYWFGRVIDSPTALIITLFPGIWVDMFFFPNFFRGARAWVDSLLVTMFLQKITVIGIRIDKVQPYVVTPWSGFLYKSLDGGISIAQLAGSIITNYLMTLDMMAALFYNGDTTYTDPLKQSYINAINSVLTPELFDYANSIPNIYGTEFRGADFTLGKNMSYADNFVKGSLNSVYGKLSKPFGVQNEEYSFEVPEKDKPLQVILTVGVTSTYQERSKYVDSLSKITFEVIDFFQIWKRETSLMSWDTYLKFKQDLDQSSGPNDEVSIIFTRIMSLCSRQASEALNRGFNVVFNYENILESEKELFLSEIRRLGKSFTLNVKLFDEEEAFRSENPNVDTGEYYSRLIEYVEDNIKESFGNFQYTQFKPYLAKELEDYKNNLDKNIISGCKILK